MKPEDLLVRVYGERQGDQWFLIALEFDLAVQSNDLDDAKQKLSAQILEYVTDALDGEDRPFAQQLLSRKAPLKYRAKYWLIKRLCGLIAKGRPAQTHKAYVDPLPLKPTCA